MNWKVKDKSSDLLDGYDELRLFAIRMKNGCFSFVAGWIDENGSVAYQDGEPSGWEWDDVSAYADIEPPNLEPGYAPCSPRFVAVADGIQATVFDTRIQRDLFPTSTGNHARECGIGTAAMIAEALNFYEANAPLSRQAER